MSVAGPLALEDHLYLQGVGAALEAVVNIAGARLAELPGDEATAAALDHAGSLLGEIHGWVALSQDQRAAAAGVIDTWLRNAGQGGLAGRIEAAYDVLTKRQAYRLRGAFGGDSYDAQA